LAPPSGQTLVRLRIPSALVLIFAGLEIAAVLAAIGAIVGEFVGAQVGLGCLIVALNFSLDVPGVFAVPVVLSVMVMHGAMRFAAHRYIFWIRRNEAPVLV
jgi:NitT/TauT family transport system permease protein